MNLTIEIEALDNELDTLGLEQARVAARIKGVQAERDALLGVAAATSDSRSVLPLDMLTKSDAIVAVLKASPTPLRANPLTAKLNAAGRNEKEDHIRIYLSTMRKEGRVRRVGVGLYTV